MKQSWKTTVVAAALLALTGAAAAADHGKAHTAAPPPSSNRQSLENADRSLDRATERQSESAAEHSNAPGNKGTQAPDHGLEHRNQEHSMGSHGKGWKNPSE